MPKRDDELLDTPSIVPDADGRGLHRQPPPRNTGKVPAASPSIGLVRTVIVVLIFTSIPCSLLYFSWIQQRKTHEQMQNRVSALELQIGSTDSALNQSSESLGNKLKTISEELKKSQARDRKMLEKHTDQITENIQQQNAMKKTQTEADHVLKKLEKTIQNNSSAINETNASLSGLRSANDALQQKLIHAETATKEAVQQAAIAREQSEQLVTQLKTIQDKIDNLNKRQSNQDDTLRSIDSFRRNVISDLSKLKQQSNELVPNAERMH